MNERIADYHAWICGDCLCLHANGDLSGYEGDADEFEQRVRANLAPKPRITGLIGENAHGQYRVTPGWGQEEHECATNYTVTDPNGYVNEVHSEAEYLDDVIGDTAHLLKLAEGDTVTITKHELRTAQDCDCETHSFRSDYCASCGTYIHGTFHGATIYEKDAS
jgi:hypothetical protein